MFRFLTVLVFGPNQNSSSHVLEFVRLFVAAAAVDEVDDNDAFFNINVRLEDKLLFKNVLFLFLFLYILLLVLFESLMFIREK